MPEHSVLTPQFITLQRVRMRGSAVCSSLRVRSRSPQTVSLQVISVQLPSSLIPTPTIRSATVHASLNFLRSSSRSLVFPSRSFLQRRATKTRSSPDLQSSLTKTIASQLRQTLRQSRWYFPVSATCSSRFS